MTESSDALNQYDAEKASRKKRQLERIAQEKIVEYWKSVGVDQDPGKARSAAEEIISNFVLITPPETEIVMKFITFSNAGHGGGSSTKPGNLLLNFRRLVTAVAAGGMTATVLGPWTAVFAAILVWDTLWSGLNVKISEREAAILWTMWKNCDLNRYITEDKILESVNRDLISNGRQPLSREEVKDSLDSLSRIKCIKPVTSIENKWWLCEWASVPF